MLKLFFILIVHGSIYSKCSAQHLRNFTISHQVRAHDGPSCHCNYASFGFESGGCYISEPAPQGYHCQCLYTEWEWSCRGEAHKCSNTSECPADCTSVFCCHAGAGEKGNCGGYKPKMSAPGHPYAYDIDLEAPGYLDPNEDKLLKYKNCMHANGIPYSRIIDRKSTEYKTVNFQWNRWFNHTYPVAFFQPLTVAEVVKSINCGRDNKLPQVPNSGAHSYSSLSFGNDDSLILDMRKMNTIKIDERGKTVTVQPGALLGRVNSLLWRRGGFGTPLGNCMTVGMGGHAIGGGIGYFAGLYGLALDNLVELTMVNSQGRELTVSETSNWDLWWAMRGVGPGYIGVVTSYKSRLFQASDIKLTFSRLQYAVKDFSNVLEGYTKWLDYAEKNIGGVFTVIFVVSDHFKPIKQPLHPGVEVQLLHIQDPLRQPYDNKEFLEAYPKFFPTTDKHIKAYPLSYMNFVFHTGYAPVMVEKPSLMEYPGAPPKLVSMGRLDDPVIKEGIRAGLYENRLDFLSLLGKDDAWPRYFKAKSFYVKKHFDAGQLKDVQAVLNKIPKQTMGLMITSEGGEIGRPRATDTAYVHRDVLYNIRIHFEGEEESEVPEGKAWFKEFWNVSTSLMDGGETYQNYPDLEVPDYLKRFYGQNLQRLIDIKRKWDPTGYFTSNEMSIPIR